jgi:hypothetical protein
MSKLGDQLKVVDRGLDKARLPHAFGGAITLAYCADEPRGTRDIDVNVFVPPERSAAVLAALPPEVRHGADDLARLERDGQVRVWWDDTPVDVFLDVHDFHREVAGGIRRVPFEGDEIPVLGCLALVVFKALFNRTKDWADIEAIAAAGAVDETEVRVALERLVGPDDDAARRVAAIFHDARS